MCVFNSEDDKNNCVHGINNIIYNTWYKVNTVKH